jgi:hypothetical protein
MNITSRRRLRRLPRIILGLTLFLYLAGCSKDTAPAPASLSTIPPTPNPTPTVSLTAAELNTAHELVASTLIAAQRDTFGRVVAEKSAFQVTGSGSVVDVQSEGIAPLLLGCNGEITASDGSQIPYSMAVVVEFGAFEIANLSAALFSRVANAGTLEMRFVASGHDKYGHPEEEQFFKASVIRAQSSKMDWNWFKNAVLSATFDPTAFNEFNIFFGDPLTAQNMHEVLGILRESAEHDIETDRQLYPSDRALFAVTTKTKNLVNCTVPAQ